MRKNSFRIYMNAPITIGFAAICILALCLAYLTDEKSTALIFSTYHSSLLDPLTYIRLICHIFGHVSINHLVSNMLYILLLGPMLEEKYHDRLITVILFTALVTGIIHNILLASITGRENGIPVTLILVAILWLGQEFYGMTARDNVSQITHIIGGLSGAILGMIFKKR